MSSSGSDSDSSSKIDAPQTTKKGSKKSAPSAAPAVVDKGKGKSKATISSDEEEESSDESSDDDDDDDEMAGRSAPRPAVIKVSKDLQYKPPSNMLPLTIQQSTSPFDYDRLANNPNLELWLIRVPDSLVLTFSLSFGFVPAAQTPSPLQPHHHLRSLLCFVVSNHHRLPLHQNARLHPQVRRVRRSG
ncbi:hypothetical protein BDY24DRAFT_194917 [Mrakia frigida]|uniref:uncharacterized protein n=1 Tax=Mrakia frigida TaxID=29902 RepID=UPI003FCC046B